MNKNTEANQQVVIEKTIQNRGRIERLEKSIQSINAKIDKGFEGIRDKMTEQVSKIMDATQIKMNDRYTKTEHQEYSKLIDARLEIIKDEIKTIRQSINNSQRSKQ